MKDNEIVELYFLRDENAISETITKYKAYCNSIAWNILHNKENAEEVVNDTWLGAWNSIPPHRPENLAAYLGKITRNISLTKWRDLNAAKRINDTVSLSQEELAECLATPKTVEQEIEDKELGKIIDSFTDELPDIEQRIFICRYFYFDSIAEISERFGYSESKVKSMLHRIRKKLKKRLSDEEVQI